MSLIEISMYTDTDTEARKAKGPGKLAEPRIRRQLGSYISHAKTYNKHAPTNGCFHTYMIEHGHICQCYGVTSSIINKEEATPNVSHI